MENKLTKKKQATWVDHEDDNGGWEWHCSNCDAAVWTPTGYYPGETECPKCGVEMAPVMIGT